TARGHRIKGSTAHIAMILKAPVVLVVDSKMLAQSCVAMVKGFIDYEPGIKIRGVILNNAGNFHKIEVVPRLEEELGIKVLGCLSENRNITMPERHLGLLPAEENSSLGPAIAAMAAMVDSEIDLAELLRLAEGAPDLQAFNPEIMPPQGLKIGVARDEAFSFYYQDSLDFLQEIGAELVFFSPLRDSRIPAVDGLYIGGGFPEMFLDDLGQNQTMIDSIREADRKGMPILAECGGLMYLAETIQDFEGKTWKGAGLVPAQVEMGNRLAALGYVEATARHDSILACQGDVLRGHEFHYSRLSGLDESHMAFSLRGGMGSEGRGDGYQRGNLLASYLHLHLRSNPQAAKYFLATCSRYKRQAQ
ncbi:MAG: cobyrinate a,c-diamide synthase, partial [Syntrophomonadaceae bacterium]